MVSPDGNTIVFAILAPLTVTIGGTTLSVTTDYPFDETGTPFSKYITDSCHYGYLLFP